MGQGSERNREWEVRGRKDEWTGGREHGRSRKRKKGSVKRKQKEE